MTEVPILDVFGMIIMHDLADTAGIDDLLYFFPEFREPKHVTYLDQTLFFRCKPSNALAFFNGRGNWLFEHEMVIELECLQGWLVVQPIGSADERNLGQLPLATLEQFLPRLKCHGIGNRMNFLKPMTFIHIRFGNRDEFQSIGVHLGVPAVRVATTRASSHQHGGYGATETLACHFNHVAP